MIPSDNDQNAQSVGAQAQAATAPQAGSSRAALRDDARRRAMTRWLGAGLVLAVIVIVALAAALRHQQQQLDTFGREATRRLDEIVLRADEARSQARLALAQSQSLEGRVVTLDNQTHTLADQQKTLTQSYRELIQGNDEAILVNIEQSLLLANEQLQLAGRVPSAIAGLQLAEARLARAGRAAFVPAQQAIARDLNRLQGLPLLDVNDISAKLDSVIAAAANLPMAATAAGSPLPAGTVEPATPAATDASSDTAAQTAWWKQAWEPVRDWSARFRHAAAQELRDLVRVRRIDQPDALLLAPEQSAWLRANITWRLLDARMALLSHETAIWQADLDAAVQAVQRYADLQAPATQRVLATLAELREVDPAPKLPDLQESLAAVRALLASAGADALDALDSQAASEE